MTDGIMAERMDRRKIELFLDKLCEDKSADILKIIGNTKLRLVTLNYQKNIDKKYYAVSVLQKKCRQENIVYFSKRFGS